MDTYKRPDRKPKGKPKKGQALAATAAEFVYR